MTEMQLQPDKASCMITCVAMVIGEKVEDLIEKINKPYKDIVFPGKEGSMKYRGHVAQDFTEYLQSIGWTLVVNYGKFPIQHFHSKGCLLCGNSRKFKGRWEEGNLLTQGNVGLLQYGNHFNAWIDDKVWNPTTGVVSDFYTTNLIGFHPMYRILRNVSDGRSSKE